MGTYCFNTHLNVFFCSRVHHCNSKIAFWIQRWHYRRKQNVPPEFTFYVDIICRRLRCVRWKVWSLEVMNRHGILPQKTEMELKKRILHLWSWKFFFPWSKLSIFACHLKKRWIRRKNDEVVIHSGLKNVLTYMVLKLKFERRFFFSLILDLPKHILITSNVDQG